ncbi:hypothetical protein ACJX0J_006768, partial [Zea mays]
ARLPVPYKILAAKNFKASRIAHTSTFIYITAIRFAGLLSSSTYNIIFSVIVFIRNFILPNSASIIFLFFLICLPEHTALALASAKNNKNNEKKIKVLFDRIKLLMNNVDDSIIMAVDIIDPNNEDSSKK